MTAIDATARVADGASIGDGVEIGPYCLVGPRVELKDGVRLVAHVSVAGDTTIGEGTIVYPFASLGTPRNRCIIAANPRSSSSGHSVRSAKG
jgi:UDP-N-acetylglucosamine acyltransferase